MKLRTSGDDNHKKNSFILDVSFFSYRYRKLQYICLPDKSFSSQSFSFILSDVVLPTLKIYVLIIKAGTIILHFIYLPPNRYIGSREGTSLNDVIAVTSPWLMHFSKTPIKLTSFPRLSSKRNLNVE